METFYDPELDLLGDDIEDDTSAYAHAYKTAPVFTGDALRILGSTVLPQRALYGRVIAQNSPDFPVRPATPKLYINTNAPFSALVCGVQGSGKSHSTSVLLESCLMADTRLGTLPEPLSALVLHFDTAAGGGLVQPCEAAYLATLDTERGGDAVPPTVTVLALPANLVAMRKVYAGLPTVRVEPLHFAAEDISGERLLAMMKVDENTQMPLYMEAIMSILRSMESDFDYTAFRDELKRQKFNPGQKAMLNLRLSLLDSCLQGGNMANRVSSHFRRGQLTIIDLSSPFMDGSSACGFFDLILGLFVEADVNAAGKLVVLDEAHKYLSDTQSGTSSRLTDSLLSIIRQQRHLATRVIISTQEPTVVPSKFLDLCSFVIAHRFSSPKWLRLLADHVSVVDRSFDELFTKVVSLKTGQAIMFAPNGLGVRQSNPAMVGTPPSDDDSGVGDSDDAGEVGVIGQGYLHVQSRLRVTRDGGHSILAVQDPAHTTRLARVPRRDEKGWNAETAAAAESAGGTSAPSGRSPAEAVAPPEPVSSSPPPNVEKSKQAQTPVSGQRHASTVLSAEHQPRTAADASPSSSQQPAAGRSFTSKNQVFSHALTPATSTAARGKAPLPLAATSSSPPHPPVFTLTGELAGFRPIIEYLQSKCVGAVDGLTVKNIRKHFEKPEHTHIYGSNLASTLADAVQLGLLQSGKPTAGKEWFRLVPNATYNLGKPTSATRPAPSGTSSKPISKTQSARTAHRLVGPNARFAPLIRYLVDQRDSGFGEITAWRMRKRFGQSVVPIIEEARSLRMIQPCPNAPNPAFMLVPDVTFEFS